VWGRDELKAGEMWNSNSMVAWLIVTAGLAPELAPLPEHGRAPGWDSGLRVARRHGSQCDSQWAPQPACGHLTGLVRVVGDDHFDVDRDGGGFGCD
jgi:hypothetical protein